MNLTCRSSFRSSSVMHILLMEPLRFDGLTEEIWAEALYSGSVKIQYNVCTLEKENLTMSVILHATCSAVLSSKRWVLVLLLRLLDHLKSKLAIGSLKNCDCDEIECMHIAVICPFLCVLSVCALSLCHVFLCDHPYVHMSLLSHLEIWLISHSESCKRVGTHRWLKCYFDDESIFKGSCTLSIIGIITILLE